MPATRRPRKWIVWWTMLFPGVPMRFSWKRVCTQIHTTCTRWNLTLTGEVLGVRAEQAAQVPLPRDPGRTMVLVNGAPVPLFQVAPDFIALQLPYRQARTWNIVVRNDSMDLAPFQVGVVEAAPVILGARRVAGGYRPHSLSAGAVSGELPGARGLCVGHGPAAGWRRGFRKLQN